MIESHSLCSHWIIKTKGGETISNGAILDINHVKIPSRKVRNIKKDNKRFSIYMKNVSLHVKMNMDKKQRKNHEVINQKLRGCSFDKSGINCFTNNRHNVS